MGLSDASEYLPKRKFTAEDFRADIEREACLFVQDRETGKMAHVFGYAKWEPGKESGEAEPEKLPGVGAFGIVIENIGQLQQVLDLIESIKGHHEFTDDWTDGASL